jgi:hypothetical protein
MPVKVIQRKEEYPSCHVPLTTLRLKLGITLLLMLLTRIDQ